MGESQSSQSGIGGVIQQHQMIQSPKRTDLPAQQQQQSPQQQQQGGDVNGGANYVQMPSENLYNEYKRRLELIKNIKAVK